jgi:hypothetical protein
MSVGPLGGIAGSAAGSPLSQTKGSEVERARQDANSQQRRVESDQKAESAAGVGETDGENHETEERDADGRRAWELPAEDKSGESTDEHGQTKSPPKDPTGNSGNLLDLSG